MTKIQHAEILARKFIKRNNFNVPFNIKKALKILNLKIRYDEKLDKLPAGLITNQNNKKLIVVNDNLPMDQKRVFWCGGNHKNTKKDRPGFPRKRSNLSMLF